MKHSVSLIACSFFPIIIVTLLTACSSSAPKPTTEPIVSLPTATDTQIVASTTPTVPTPTPTLAPTSTSSPTPKPTATIAPTFTPSPTPTFVKPTKLLEPKLYVLDVTKGNEVPSDLLDFLEFFQGGAGGMFCGVDGPLAWRSPFNGAVVAALPRMIEWPVANSKADSEVKVTITLPDGSAKQFSEKVMGNNCLSITYEIVPGAPLGTYKIELTIGSQTLTDSFILDFPSEPTQTEYQEKGWFTGFKPYEEVTLLLYYHETVQRFLKPKVAALFPDLPDLSNEPLGYGVIVFLEQQKVVADEYGTFQIEVTSDQLVLHGVGIIEHGQIIIVARGEVSGTSHYVDLQYNGYDAASLLAGSCNGALPTRLKIGSLVKTTDHITEMMIDPKHPLPPTGTRMTVVSGPYCLSEPGFVWTLVMEDQTRRNLHESDASGYYLEPVNP